MSRESFLVRLLYFFRIAILIDLVLFAAVAGLCLLLQRTTLAEYGQSLVWASLVVFLVGASSVVTNIGLDRSPSIRYGQSVGLEKMAEYARRGMKEEKAANEFLLLMVTVGVFAFAAGLLLQTSG